MKNTSIFCLTLKPDHEEIIKRLSYIPVGLGNQKFSEECLSDKNGDSISFKNPFYGEYTFHYWVWKNYLDKIKTKWVGFCQYRKFFFLEKAEENGLSFKSLKNSIILDAESLGNNFDCILGKKFKVDSYKFSKIIKNHLVDFLLNPTLILNKKKRNLKFHFDLFHGKGNLESAIKLLDSDNQNDFRQYMNNNTSFNPHNMFICKTQILKNYYNVVFPWLAKCENLFGFENLSGYGQKRIYGFLAERFMSFWFNKNYKVKELEIIVKDLSDYRDL